MPTPIPSQKEGAIKIVILLTYLPSLTRRGNATTDILIYLPSLWEGLGVGPSLVINQQDGEGAVGQ